MLRMFFYCLRSFQKSGDFRNCFGAELTIAGEITGDPSDTGGRVLPASARPVIGSVLRHFAARPNCSGGAHTRRSACSSKYFSMFIVVTALLGYLGFVPAQAQALSAPTISPASGSFVTSQSVTMSASEGTIYYTLDGSQPDTSSSEYSSAITITGPTQVNAVAYQSGTYSSVTTAFLDVDPTLLSVVPTFTSYVNESGGGHETITFAYASGNNVTATLGGTFQSGDVLSITATMGGIVSATVSQTVGVDESASSVASQLASAINDNAGYQSAGISATSSGDVITITNPLVLRLTSSFAVDTGVGSPLPVSAWNDLSGQDNVLTGSGTTEPVLLSSPSGSTVSFNGTSQYLSLPSGFSSFPNGITIFVVTQPNSLVSDARIIDLGDGASGNDIELQIGASGSTAQLGIYSGTTGAFASSAGALSSGQNQVIEAVVSSSGATVLVNGQAGTTNTSITSIPDVSRTSNYLAQASSGGDYYSGNISEVLICNAALGVSTRAAIRAFLMQEYQVQSLTPPAPIISVASGTLLAPTQVAVASEPESVTYITEDGTTPTTASPVYCGPVTINYSQTLQAMCVRNGVQSSVASATYTLDSTQFPAPSSGDTTAPTINLTLPAPTE